MPTSLPSLGSRWVLAIVIAALVAPGGATAQEDPLGDRPRVEPTRAETPPVIDGILDDRIWARAVRLTEFVQQQPLDGAPATEDTELWLAYDSEHMYVAAYAHYEDPSIMRANRGERDRMWADDLITIYFDTFRDQTQAYDFDVNGYGVQGDGIIARAGRGEAVAIPRADRSWNALFESAGQIVEDGFTVEMAIPFKSIRYPAPENGVHRWGFQVVREVKAKNEENIVWAPMSRAESSFFNQMGVIEGMTDLSTSRNVEILPTFTGIQYGEIDPTVPTFANQTADPDAGVNLKYGITSDLTADFTINPDFSQIESDRPQIEVNQRFPLFFPELRPFFLEGNEIFNILSPITLIHTRTIVDPDWGAKLTGRAGRVSLGVLTANDRAPGNFDDPTNPLNGLKAQSFIGRALYDLYPESTLGIVATDREFSNGHSRLAGSDVTLRLTPTIVFNAQAIGTWHRDEAGVSSNGHVLGTRTVRAGRNVQWDLNLFQLSPDLRSDLGFVRRADIRHVSTGVTYRAWPESGAIVNWGPTVRYMRVYDYAGVLQDESRRVGLDFNFDGNISAGSAYQWELEHFAGIDFVKKRWAANARFNTTNTLSFGGNYSIGDQVLYSATPFLGDGTNWGVNATIRPTSRIESQLNVNSSRLTDPNNAGAEIFDIQIFRNRTNVQFTERLGMRNIIEFNTFDETFDLNVLFNYRVNAGTVFFFGYDDHYQQEDLIRLDQDNDGIPDQIFFGQDLRRTNRAFFVKLQYLIRY